jgi:hypothetical protein
MNDQTDQTPQHDPAGNSLSDAARVLQAFLAIDEIRFDVEQRARDSARALELTEQATAELVRKEWQQVLGTAIQVAELGALHPADVAAISALSLDVS